MQREENFIVKHETPGKVVGPYFQIQHKQRNITLSQARRPNQISLPAKRPVGRPRKQQINVCSISEIAPEDQLNNILQWIHQNSRCKISLGPRQKKKWVKGEHHDQERIKIKRHRGYKKNMACPLIDLLLVNPRGHTTKVLTEQVLRRMEVKLSEESQDKMRRRIYEFLMVMKTSGIIYSEEQKPPFIDPKLIQIVTSVKFDYFQGFNNMIEDGMEQEMQSNENEREMERVQPNGRRRKKYNKKKGLCVQQFLTSPSLRNKHLQWLKDKINHKRQMVADLKALIHVLRTKPLKKDSNLFVIGVNNDRKEKFFPVQIVASNYQMNPPHTFALVTMENQYLKGDLVVKPGNQINIKIEEPINPRKQPFNKEKMIPFVKEEPQYP